MNKPYRDHEDAVAESFRNDPALAAEYLNAVREDGDQQEVMLAMRRIAEAFGVREVAESASLNAKTLYRTLSPAGNPQLSSLRAILAAVGLRLAVMPIAAN